MIYTRFGSPVEIVADCGEHTFTDIDEDGSEFLYENIRLVKLHIGEGRYTFYFTHFLKAEGGDFEIAQALNEAPTLKLKGKDLDKALYLAS